MRTTTHTYDASGVLQTAVVDDDRDRTYTYTSTASGQTIRKSEQQHGLGTTTGQHETWYRFGGKELGYSGNNGTLETSYSASITSRMSTTVGNGPFRNGAAVGSSHTSFDPSLSQITSYNQGSSAGGYTVRAGETLGSIAANLWGDSALWYKLAQANGLSGEAALSEGQSLRIPAGVMKNTHNASTFKPYDPGETIGDTAPTSVTPKPPKKNKCGAFGQVLLVVVAAVVAVASAGALAGAAGWVAGGVLGGVQTAFTAAGLGLTGWTGAAAGAFGAAAGSAASQAIGVAFNIQEKFSWTAVATAAFSGGLGGSGNLGISSRAVRSMAANALSQAASVALGPAKKFSWASAAAAGVSSFVPNGMGPASILTHSARGIASAATRTAFGDGNFEDNLRAVIPDIIGQALASAITSPSGARIRASIPAIEVDPVTISPDYIYEPGGVTVADQAQRASAAAMDAGTASVKAPDVVPAKEVQQSEHVHPEMRLETILVTGHRPPPVSQLLSVTMGPGESEKRGAFLRAFLRPDSRNQILGGALARGGIETAISTAQLADDLSAPKQLLRSARLLFDADFRKTEAQRSAAIVSGLDKISFKLKTDPGGLISDAAGSVLSTIDREVVAAGGTILNDEFGLFTPGVAGFMDMKFTGTLGFDLVTAPVGFTKASKLKGVGGLLDNIAAESVAINPRLTTRLGKWRDYQAAGGQLDMQGWVKATKGQSWGLGGRSGYGNWIRSVESTHGNSLLSGRSASLYELYTTDGKFLKYGVSQNPYSRYSGSFMTDKEIFPIATGTRREMITLERQMVTQNPGPLNLEPWAKAARAAGRGQ